MIFMKRLTIRLTKEQDDALLKDVLLKYKEKKITRISRNEYIISFINNNLINAKNTNSNQG